MAGAFPKPTLRPFLPQDAPLLAVIFQASIEELTGDDYGESQQAVWAAEADDLEAFAEKLAGGLTLIASFGESPVGFAAMKDGHIDMLYVHPAATGQGVATALSDALEKLAAGRGLQHVTVDASDTARRFFERRGYTAERRNSIPLGGEWFANTTMRKRLAPAPKEPLP